MNAVFIMNQVYVLPTSSFRGINNLMGHDNPLSNIVNIALWLLLGFIFYKALD